MGDIVRAFAKIGNVFLKDEKRIKNKAYEYDSIKVFLCDIEEKTIEPNFNIPKNEMIITRFGVGANSGNLFPNQPYKSKDMVKDYAKFIKGVLKSNKNLLSYFTDEEIEKNEILKILNFIDKKLNMSFFFDISPKIVSLEENKEKGKKATYFALSYKGKPISAYFTDIYEKHISKKEASTAYGYDILTNEEGVGSDANLAFCSTNELPKALQSIKPRLLALNSESAKKIKNGFTVMDTRMSHNFYGLKMAILPTLLSKDEILYEKILNILQDCSKGNLEEIEQSEIYINSFLESVAKNESQMPVLNTILFYNKNNAAVDVLLQIDDVLPSFISHVSDRMSSHEVKAFKNKDVKDSEGTIYLQNLFSDRLEIMNFLLSQTKVDIDIIIGKYAQLIYDGNVSKKYAFIVDWGKYFNGYYANRSIDAIQKYQKLFNEIEVTNQKLTLQKECNLEEVTNKKEKINTLMENSDFLKENVVLKSAYLLGMFSSALISWQYAINNGDSYNKWLNNSGAITKDSLERIWKKAEETRKKLENTAKKKSKNVNVIKECLVEILPQSFMYEKLVKSSYITLAFAMGGSDYKKHIKEKTGE